MHRQQATAGSGRAQRAARTTSNTTTQQRQQQQRQPKRGVRAGTPPRLQHSKPCRRQSRAGQPAAVAHVRRPPPRLPFEKESCAAPSCRCCLEQRHLPPPQRLPRRPARQEWLHWHRRQQLRQGAAAGCRHGWHQQRRARRQLGQLEQVLQLLLPGLLQVLAAAVQVLAAASLWPVQEHLARRLRATHKADRSVAFYMTSAVIRCRDLPWNAAAISSSGRALARLDFDACIEHMRGATGPVATQGPSTSVGGVSTAAARFALLTTH